MLSIKLFEVNPFQENCYIVSDSTGEAVAIDCGAFFEEERTAVVKYIRDNRLKLKHLIATHAHIDHNFGNNTIFEEFAVGPEVSVQDSTLMGQLSLQAKALCQVALNYEMPSVSSYFSESDVIRFGTHSLSILATPGHTPGSVFFYCEEELVAFSGDTLFQGSIGRTDLWLGSYDSIISSLRRIKGMLPPETRILPGHGPQTTMRQELEGNPFLR